MSGPHFSFCTCAAWVNKTFPDWNVTLRMQMKIIERGGGGAGISPRHHLGQCSDVTSSGESLDREEVKVWVWTVKISLELRRASGWIFYISGVSHLKCDISGERWFEASLPARNMLTPGDLIWDELYKRGKAIHCKIKASSLPIEACISLLKHHMITSLRKHSLGFLSVFTSDMWMFRNALDIFSQALLTSEFIWL